MRHDKMLPLRALDLIRTMHDDDHPSLRIVLGWGGYEITRADGSELSESETRHVRAVIAAWDNNTGRTS